MSTSTVRRTERPRAFAAALAVLLALAAPVSLTGNTWSAHALEPADRLRVIVHGAPGAIADVVHAVGQAGGQVLGRLAIVNGVTAELPTSRVEDLGSQPGVVSVTPDRRIEFQATSYGGTSTGSAFVGSTGAGSAWAGGQLGAGVGVAVIDTGTSPMPDFAGRLVHGPDLSGEGSTIDTFGHGTVMAGLVGGNGADSGGAALTGVAPEATVVSVKVAGRNGVTDVSTVLQAMHWVSAYREQYNIRVVNLSWGTTSTQDPSIDPLNYAVQRLWNDGIVVVVSAGNSGSGAGTIRKPGDDPVVITAGAYDDRGSVDDTDDKLPQWTSRGPTAAGLSKPDLVAPGRTVVSQRSYGSTVESDNPKALVSPSYIKGSGTSQAAAITSGLAALLVGARPELTPDQVKAVLVGTARPLSNESTTAQGAGRVNLAAALTATPGPAQWQSRPATGLGSLEASRGGRHVETDCGEDGTLDVIQGEITAQCAEWNGGTWTGGTWTGGTWTGGTWTGGTWTGGTWTGGTWTGGTWTGGTWTGGTWTGGTWTTGDWTGGTWTGGTWTGGTWTGGTWTGGTWTGGTWTGGLWTDTEDEFLTAFWGARPPHWKTLPGEVSDDKPKWRKVTAADAESAAG